MEQYQIKLNYCLQCGKRLSKADYTIIDDVTVQVHCVICLPYNLIIKEGIKNHRIKKENRII